MKDADTTADLYRVVCEIRRADGRTATVAGQPISRDTAAVRAEEANGLPNVSARVVTEDEYQQDIQPIIDAQATGGAA